MAALDSLEKTLDNLFVKSAPALPENGKKNLVAWLPWINLVLGVFSLLTAYWLWHWAHAVNTLIDYTNAVFGTNVAVDRMDTTVWLGLAVIVVAGVLYLMAFQPTQKRLKSGWNLMFYAMLLQVLYSVVMMFSNYSGSSSIGTIIGTVIGLWLLFQIRSMYSPARAVKKA